MEKIKKFFHKFFKEYFYIACAAILILLALVLLLFSNITSMQSIPAMVGEVYFEGEYRIGEGHWQPIVEGQHISATQGEVTLRGNIHTIIPDGTYGGIYRGELPVAFYTNHVNLVFYLGDDGPYYTDMENPLCGESWTAFTFLCPEEDMIQIIVNNPHSFGNENAIDEMLSTMALWSGIDFEKGVLDSGGPQRDVGLLFVILSLMLLGIALFSSLIHIKNNSIIWHIGFVALSAGIYFAYSSDGVSFWSDSIATNTTMLGISMMLYMFFITRSIHHFLKRTKKIVNVAVILLAAVDALLLILPTQTPILFYDTWPWWVIAQTVINIVLAVCLVIEFLSNKTRERWAYIGMSLPLVAFFADVIGIWLGAWTDAIISQYFFVLLFAVITIMVLKFIPHNINAATKAKELEMEKIVLNAQLAESRISTMMSQIRPHFIYNTLGSIEQLCKFDPPKAGELVHNFAKYLRGNFGELDNPKPILMSQEMEHVHHYISIENVRFPDMTFTFEMNSDDFHIPALTIQPIVENAIKHGLMKLQKGGTIHVVSYETDSEYCISVEDDGVGFDTNTLLDDRKHLGLRNIRERLKVMVNGTLEIESTVGVGTKVVVRIPKEVEK